MNRPQAALTALLFLSASTTLAIAEVIAAGDSELVDFESVDEASADPRLFFVNFTSSLVAVNSTILAYALLGLAILAAGAIALYYLYLESQNAGGSNCRDGYCDGDFQYAYARSNDASYADFDVLNVLRWIQVLQEMYSDFDYNDLECQKKIICEVMKEPEYFGSTAQKFKTGFRYARYLEAFSLPDDLRELLDEYMDADARSEQGKECANFFQCPYSLKDSVMKNVSNDLK